MSWLLLWRRGLKEPSIAVTLALDEYDRKNKLAEPIKISDEDAKLPLDMLARLYPPPKQEDQ